MNLSKLKKLSSKGFTLIELLVVIAVLGVLAAATVTAINPVAKMNQAKDSTVKSDLAQIANALQAYYVAQTTPAYPAALSTLLTNELKTVPQQQSGYSTCGTGGVSTNYCYLVATGPVADVGQVAVFAHLFSNPNVIYCWDSKGATFKTSAAGATPNANEPTATAIDCK